MELDPQFVAFIGLAALLTVTPGADTVLVVRNSAAGGTGVGIRTTVGICSGLFIHATLSTLGLSALLLQSATAFAAMKLIGAAYLVWLGLLSLRAAVSPPVAGPRRDLRAGRNPFAQGLLSNVLNPKVAAFYLALLPQFIGPSEPVLQKSLLLASVHCVLGLAWLAAVAVGVSRSRRRLARPWLGRSMQALAGAFLVALGTKLALARR
jgi:threonine/homoserine/homoserine lactone efflux protein